MNKTTTKFRCLLTVLMLVAAMALPSMAWAGIAPSSPTKGDGTSDNPYQISTAAEFYWFADKVNKDNSNYSSTNAVLIEDIDIECSKTNPWTPIASSAYPFNGTFDGGGHIIAGLYCEKIGYTGGLFGYLGEDGVIKNLGVYGTVFCAKESESGVIAVTNNTAENVGGVCGRNEGTISGCYFYGSVTGTNRFTGGICGRNGGTITCCYNAGSVNGIVEFKYSSTTEDKDVRGVGGICGYNYGGTVSNCYNTGAVIGKSIAGGVCGNNKTYRKEMVVGKVYAYIKNCYNIGKVIAPASSSVNLGGVCGMNNDGNITSCYFLSGCNGEYLIDDIFNDKDKAISAEDFKDSSKFINWDFNTVWEMSGLWGRPTLRSVPEIKCDGTETHPYLIFTLAMLEQLRDDVNGGKDFSGEYFALKINIDMSGTYNRATGKSWTPIGGIENKEFNGTFDGGGHKITGLYINSTNDNSGLFGKLGVNGVVENLGIEDGNIDGNGKSSIGGVCGLNLGTIENCYYIGAVEKGFTYVGGVCGWNSGKIEGCYHSGVVNGTSSIGGICGISANARIANCYNIGDVVTASSEGGGVCGIVSGSDIRNCYSVGAVNGKSSIGGVCGKKQSGSIFRCYYDSDKCSVGAIDGKDVISDKTEGKRTKEFESGEVCYFLNNASQLVVWGQQLGMDQYPVPNSAYKVIAMSKKTEDETYWATFSNFTSDVTLSVPSYRTLKVFNVTVSGGALKLSRRADGQVAMNEGVLLKTDEMYVNMKANDANVLTAVGYSDNNLVATPQILTTIKAEDGYTFYELKYKDNNNDLGFYLSGDGSKITITKFGYAYLKAQTEDTKTSSGVQVYRFVLISEGIITGIENVTVAEDNLEDGDEMYDLFGRKVINPVPGIYIKNGEKVFVK